MVEEVWKDIVDYEGFYQISNLGRVKTLERYRFNKFRGDCVYKEKILKPISDKRDGSLGVSLCKNGKFTRKSLSRLVGLHFLSSPEDSKMVICRLNDDKSNNSVNNLFWGYLNKHKAKIKKQTINIIKNENPIKLLLDKVSGIYQITNIYNNTFYIGSSYNIVNRLSDHFKQLRRNCHHSHKLQRSFNKYGEGYFEVKILEKCDREVLEKREQYYFDNLKPQLNVAQISRGSCGKHSEESKLKMRDNANSYFLNLSEEKRKWRKDIITKSNKLNKSKKVDKFTLNGEYLQTFDSIAEAGKSMGKSNSTNIGIACRGNYKTAYNYIWKFKNEEVCQ